MKKVLDLICPRCNFRASVEGLSIEVAREIASLHVCADGVAVPRGAAVIERVLYGPGERLKDTEAL